MIDQAARARLEGWKLSLLDLSTRNPLLDARDGATCIALPGIDPVRLAAALASGSTFAVESAPEVAEPGDSACFDTGHLRAPVAAAELDRRLVAIRRTARAELADGGIHTMWLALGLLHWTDGGGTSHASPLWLYPVELERSGGGLRLAASQAVEPRFNVTLGEKLRRDLGLAFEGVVSIPVDGAEPVIEELDLAGVLEAAEGIALTRPGWRVDRGVVLGSFSFAQLAIWKDLEARTDELLAHPVVAHLAAGRGGTFAQPSAAAASAVTAPAGAAMLVERRLGTDLIAPLDADAGQLAAVAAAGAGASFVLQGPPGTGKSQTIANLLVNAVSQGKSVLFVSEKTAALEVVHQRLAAVGLGELCLELHSHKAGRAAVLQQLGRVLDRAFRPGAGPISDDARLAELRGALDAHAAALHRTGPLGRSLHEVLGRLVELRTTPRAALAEGDATGLDGTSFDRRRNAVVELARAALAVEPVAAHPWQLSTLDRGPGVSAAAGRDLAVTALDEAAAAAAALGIAAREVAALVPGLVARTRDQLAALGALAALAASSPRPGAELLTNLRTARGDEIGEQIALLRARGSGAIEVPRDPLSFLLLAKRHRLLAAEVDDVFTERIGDLDAPALWSQLRKWLQSVAPVRYVALRGVRAEVRAAVRSDDAASRLETDAAMITALEAVIAEAACRKALLDAAEPAKRWFGDLGGDPVALDLPKIDAAVSWAAELRKAFDGVALVGGEQGKPAAWRALVAQVAAGPSGPEGAAADAAMATPFTRLAEAVERWIPALAAVAETTGIDRSVLGAGPDHLGALREQLETLRHSVDALGDWVGFHAARRTALAAGVGPAVTAIEQGDLGAAELAGAWERATLLAWADAEIAQTPALARFHGASHHAHVAAFADLDRAMLALVRSRALVRLAERLPRASGQPGGELEILLQELKKPRRHRPLRKLFAELPTLLPRLAPCMLMSPLAVAELLGPVAGPAVASRRFDIVVFDEASRLPTAQAIGAMSRGDAVVIVGDARQLPPARAVDADGADAGDLASVLADGVAAGLPELRLAWHYRSKHEDLIAFANRHYYADRLQVLPAAQGSPELGIAWRRVEGTSAQAGDGAMGHDRAEAAAVVAEVMSRLRDPGQRARSIAVVTFSRAQQELIEDLLDEARAAEPSLERYFEGDATQASTEPVIVKHALAMQGDERDLVLLSVGYGADATFGPLAEPGGERWLNVAITRAREQLIVFSRFAPEDVGGDAATGVRDLAALIAFAQGGGGAARPADDVAPASPITAAIARALTERGWIVRHQVGCGAYHLDLAIVDPNDPDRYVLAIEHDGAAYASAPAARDRDRLRAQVLAQLGWRLHRIWSLDWWADAEGEIQRAHGAIVAAVAATRQRRSSSLFGAPAGNQHGTLSGTKSRPQRAPMAAGSSPIARIPPKGPSVEAMLATAATDATPVPGRSSDTMPQLAAGSAPVRIARGSIAIGPYTVAAIPAGRRAPDDLFAPRHLPELGKIVEQVLAAEAPMTIDLLARRVGAYFGIGRVTQRVTEQVRAALLGRGRLGDEPNVVWRMDQDPAGVPAVRVAGNGPSARRDIGEVPLSELAAAARIVVERAAGIGATELVRDAARLLGFARITEQVTERIAVGVQLAHQRSLIQLDGAGKARLPD